MNHSLPSRPDTLRILAVGNSFSDDGTEYLPPLLEAAGIRNVVLGRLYIGGCSLENHCREYEQEQTDYTYSKSIRAGRWIKVAEKAGIREALHDEKWDVVTIQETSGFGGVFPSGDSVRHCSSDRPFHITQQCRKSSRLIDTEYSICRKDAALCRKCAVKAVREWRR